MRERALIHVAGPPGSGKTTFVEAILNAAGAPVLASRCVRDDALRQARETAPKNHPELRRYRQAGASGVALFAFPENDIGSDAFFMTNLMMDYSQAVLLEGDNPLGFIDLAIFVAPAPRANETLFVRRTRNLAAAERAKAAIAERYAGIQHAQLVVVNIRSESEQEGGEQIVADVVRLRKDEELYDDILGFRGSKIPITAVVANLTDPDDPGRKKALARAARVALEIVVDGPP
jgi:hypothetical protein